ncbi:hypothetical protein DFH06DRAFT_1414828 [Mycena polygramma]|nr:hypothetical protein DFH06DRAFT_1414828 [Mycena polygramma]
MSALKFRMYKQFESSTKLRTDVTEEPGYAGVRSILQAAQRQLHTAPPALEASWCTILNFFVQLSPARAAARAAFSQNFPNTKGGPTVAQLSGYLRGSPPNVVIARCEDGEAGQTLWRNVAKGTDPETRSNELVLPAELNTHTTQQTEVLRTYFQFLIAVTYMHEIEHCVCKYFFSSDSTTPMTAAPGTTDEKGQKEAGSAFERNYIGFLLQCEWDDQGEAVAGSPLETGQADCETGKYSWRDCIHPQYVCSAMHWMILLKPAGPATVEKIFASLADDKLYEIDLKQETPTAGSPPSDAVRWWVQYPGAEGGEEEAAAMQEDCTAGVGLVWRDRNGDNILL